MNTITYILILIIALGILLIWFFNTYNRFQEYIIRMNEAESNIDATLRKRFDLLNKAATIIKSNVEEEEVLPMIAKLRSKKLSNFELDRELYEAINEFYRYREEHDDIKNNEEIAKIYLNLQESEAEIVALRKYYNDIITDYNKIARTFPSIVTAKACGYKPKTYFDGKNMEDDDIKDFKL